MIDLSDLQPFAIGGRRECYIHPLHPDRCLKVIRSEFPPNKLRKKSGFFRALRKSADDFNENLSDLRVLRELAASNHNRIWDHLPKCHGMEETNRGGALSTELFRDADGLISRSLLDHLTRHGSSPRMERGIDAFCSFWESHTIASRNLGLHNIVVRDTGEALELKLIDGFGSTQASLVDMLFLGAAKRRSARKAARLRDEVRSLLDHPPQEPIRRGVLLDRGARRPS